MRRTAPLLLLASLAFLCIGRPALASELELIERLPGAIDEHTLVMLDEMQAMVAWERDDGPSDETVWTSRRDAAGRWSVPEIVEFSQGHARELQIAADGSGTVTVIWIQEELGLDGLWANQYRADQGWQHPLRVEPVAGELYAPQLGIVASGRGFALWERRTGERLGVRASRYTPEDGWSTPRDIDTGEGDATSPRLAVHGDDSAIAVWSQREPTGNRIVRATRFTRAQGWSLPDAISTPGDDAYDAQIAMDADGNAMVAWEQAIDGEESIFARRFDVQSGWSAQTQLELDHKEGYGPRLAVGADGNAVVAWVRTNGEAGSVVAARYIRENGWEPPHTVQGGALLYLFDLHVAGNAHGEVLATWCQTDDSRNNVWYARFAPGAGWQAPALAEKRAGSAHRPRAAADTAGNFSIIWKTVDSPLPEQAIYSLWYRRVP